MIRLTACLLLTTATLAQNYGSSGAPSSVPMDYNDDIYNRDMRIQPSSNFFYNFQQARIDQPPQVEVREENLGKYMGRPRTTTHVIPKLNEERVTDINTVHLHRLADHNTGSTMSPYVPLGPYNAHLPATMPPPPTTPRWMDLSDDSFKNHAHHKPSRYAVNPMNTYQPPQTPAPVQPTSQQWSQPASLPALYNDDRFNQQQPVEMGYSNQMPQYYNPTTEDVMGGDRYIREPAVGRSRGNHKFNWSDLALPADAAQPVTSTMRAPAPPVAQKRPPPSIPTLTPWSGDSFGK